MPDYFTTTSIVSSNRVLYTPSEFARSSLLHLQEIGSLKALSPHTSSRSNLASFLFFTVVSGEGSLVYDGREFALRVGDCVFIDCRRPYSHTTSDELWALRWVHFDGPSMSEVYSKYCDRGGQPVFHPEYTAAFLAVLNTLYALASGQDYIRDMRINEELGRLLTLLMEQSWQPAAVRPSSKKIGVSAVKAYLEEHYASEITLNDLAARFFINKYYLSRMFRAQYGMSVMTCLTSIRITHAKQLLRFTELSVEEVGLACGLGQLNYFSRTFKAVEGVPPSVYRKLW